MLHLPVSFSLQWIADTPSQWAVLSSGAKVQWSGTGRTSYSDPGERNIIIPLVAMATDSSQDKIIFRLDIPRECMA